MEASSFVFYICSLYSKHTRKLVISGKKYSGMSAAYDAVKSELRAGEAISMFWPNY